MVALCPRPDHDDECQPRILYKLVEQASGNVVARVSQADDDDASKKESETIQHAADQLKLWLLFLHGWISGIIRDVLVRPACNQYWPVNHQENQDVVDPHLSERRKITQGWVEAALKKKGKFKKGPKCGKTGNPSSLSELFWALLAVLLPLAHTRGIRKKTVGLFDFNKNDNGKDDRNETPMLRGARATQNEQWEQTCAGFFLGCVAFFAFKHFFPTGKCATWSMTALATKNLSVALHRLKFGACALIGFPSLLQTVGFSVWQIRTKVDLMWVLVLQSFRARNPDNHLITRAKLESAVLKFDDALFKLSSSAKITPENVSVLLEEIGNIIWDQNIEDDAMGNHDREEVFFFFFSCYFRPHALFFVNNAIPAAGRTCTWNY